MSTKTLKPLTMDVKSQMAEVSRNFIMNFPRLKKQYSNRGTFENYRLQDEYRKHMKYFVDYWYNHPDAGFWFNAPFMLAEDPTPEKQTKPKTINDPGKRIAKDLYEIVNSEETEGIILETEYNDSVLMEDYEDDENEYDKDQ